MRDLMTGNPKLREAGFKEEAIGHNAIVGGFKDNANGQTFAERDFSETILNSSFDWNGIREAFVFATENDALNGVTMLFGHLLTNTSQIFSDVRTYWSPEAVKRVTGKELTGDAKNGIIHLINSGATTLDGTGRQTANGKPAMKQPWDITNEEVEACLAATMVACGSRLFPRWRLFINISYTWRHACYYGTLEHCSRFRARITNCRRLDGGYRP